MTDSMEEIINDLRKKNTVKQGSTRMNRFIIKTLEVKSSHISWSQKRFIFNSNYRTKNCRLNIVLSEFGSCFFSPIRRKTTTLNIDSKVGITTPKNVDSFLGCRCWLERFRTFPGCCSEPWPPRADFHSDSLTLAERR